MINLCLVVIANQFSETRRRETIKMKQEREEFSSESSFSSFTERCIFLSMKNLIKNSKFYCYSEDEEEDTNLYRDIINLIHYYIRRFYYRLRKFRRVKLIKN